MRATLLRKAGILVKAGRAVVSSHDLSSNKKHCEAIR